MSSNKSFRLSSSPPLKVEEEMAPKVMEKQGIVSILGSDSQGPEPAASFRRTLSADMSSKKWLAQNGFKSPTMKKIASSEQLSIINSSFSSSDGEEVEEESNKLNQFQKQVDVWSSIMSQTKKTEELPPPYVHPLVKKSNSALSKKSLQICTESLGSETGSDGFSSHPCSETSSEADEEETQQQEREYLQSGFDTEELPVVAKYNYSAAAGKKVQPRSFPPPLPSLKRSCEGPSLHMHSHRVNGRLVLEAVSVPSTKNFHAQRQDGRLRLTLFNTPIEQEKVEQANLDEVDFEEMCEIFQQEEENEAEKDDDEEEEEEEMAEVEKQIKGPKDMGIVMEQAVPKMTSGLICVHRSALMMKKVLMGIENQNPKWSQKFNYTPAKLVEVDAEEETTQLPQSLPPRPRVARLIPGAPAASFNAYEYFWRAKPAAASLKNQLTHHYSPIKNNTANKVVAFNKPKAYEQQELVVLRNCKEARRYLLSWEPYCIATS